VYASFAFKLKCAEVVMSNLQTRRAHSTHFWVQDAVNANRHTLILSGELDIAAAHDLESVILRICGEVHALILDLRRLTFMDSDGLRLILLAASLCRERRCECTILPGEHNIHHLLEISGDANPCPTLVATPASPIADA
jgi:anti-anti-sigma factor